MHFGLLFILKNDLTWKKGLIFLPKWQLNLIHASLSEYLRIIFALFKILIGVANRMGKIMQDFFGGCPL